MEAGVVLSVEGQRVPVGRNIWQQFTTLRNIITDMEIADGDEIPLPFVRVFTIEWVRRFTESVQIPADEWTKSSVEEICKAPIDAPVLSMLRELPEHSIASVLTDLSFLGGGFIYCCVCRYVALLIKESGWDVPSLQKRFVVC